LWVVLWIETNAGGGEGFRGASCPGLPRDDPPPDVRVDGGQCDVDVRDAHPGAGAPGGGQYSRVLQVSRPEITQMVGRGGGEWDVSVETKGTPSPTKGANSGL